MELFREKAGKFSTYYVYEEISSENISFLKWNLSANPEEAITNFKKKHGENSYPTAFFDNRGECISVVNYPEDRIGTYPFDNWNLKKPPGAKPITNIELAWKQINNDSWYEHEFY